MALACAYFQQESFSITVTTKRHACYALGFFLQIGKIYGKTGNIIMENKSQTKTNHESWFIDNGKALVLRLLVNV